MAGSSSRGVHLARRGVKTSDDTPLRGPFVTASRLRVEGYADLLAVQGPDRFGSGNLSRIPRHPPKRRYDGETRGTNHGQSNCAT